jgi:hypothetical protein
MVALQSRTSVLAERWSSNFSLFFDASLSGSEASVSNSRSFSMRPRIKNPDSIKLFGTRPVKRFPEKNIFYFYEPVSKLYLSPLPKGGSRRLYPGTRDLPWGEKGLKSA